MLASPGRELKNEDLKVVRLFMQLDKLIINIVEIMEFPSLKISRVDAYKP